MRQKEPISIDVIVHELYPNTVAERLWMAKSNVEDCLFWAEHQMNFLSNLVFYVGLTACIESAIKQVCNSRYYEIGYRQKLRASFRSAVCCRFYSASSRLRVRPPPLSARKDNCSDSEISPRAMRFAAWQQSFRSAKWSCLLKLILIFAWNDLDL